LLLSRHLHRRLKPALCSNQRLSPSTSTATPDRQSTTNDAAKASVPKLFCCPGAPFPLSGSWLCGLSAAFLTYSIGGLTPPSAPSPAALASRLPRSPITYHIKCLLSGLRPREAQNWFRQPDLATNHGREAGCSGGLINLLFSPMPRVQGGARASARGARASAQLISLAGAGWEPALGAPPSPGASREGQPGCLSKPASTKLRRAVVTFLAPVLKQAGSAERVPSSTKKLRLMPQLRDV